MDLQLQDKGVLITGSSDGIGRAIAETLAAEGATVVVHGRNGDKTRKVAADIVASGGRAHAVTGDLTDVAQARRLADEARALAGGIDILINNAGGRSGGGKDTLEADPADWTDTFRLNLNAALVLAGQLAPDMRERGWGRIINISSMAGSIIRGKSSPDYAASKAALNSLTLSLAHDLRATGISVTTVSPGPILTPALEAYIRDKICAERPDLSFAEAERIAANDYFSIPLGRIGRPEEVAAMIAVLVSPITGYCHATNVHIDGGCISAIN